MDGLRKTLPPAGTLVAFEAAARHVNFTRAAEELSVSQAAVSKHVQTLERDLGVSLFHRRPRKLALTEEGRKFYQAVTVSLRHMAQVAEELRQLPGEARLIVSTTMAFASYWLLPRLARFRTRYPEVDVVLLASDPYFGDVSTTPHVSIRFHRPEPPGDDVRLLFGEEIFPVCSPAFLEGKAVSGLSGLAQEPLLHLEEPRLEPMNWPVWLAHFGIDLPETLQGPKFPNFNEVMFAAENGQGVSLGWRHLCDDALATGRLVRPVEETLNTQWAYYLLLPERHQAFDQAQAFADWVEEEAAVSRGS